jgi:hypothetical protein
MNTPIDKPTTWPETVKFLRQEQDKLLQHTVVAGGLAGTAEDMIYSAWFTQKKWNGLL